MKLKLKLKQALTSEKNQPFRLVKYFTLSSLILIFISTVTISVSNTHWMRALQYKKSEKYAQLLVENLNHQIFLQFILPIALHYGKIDLKDNDQFRRIDDIVKSTFHSFKANMVNIYGRSDIIAYSFDKKLIGTRDNGGILYKSALEGNITSKLVRVGSIWQNIIGVPEQVKMVTFAPLRVEKPLSPLSGPPIAVVEVVQDLSEDYQKVFKSQILVLITISIVMAVLLVVLVYIVRRGEKIIEKRTLERILLKDQLAKAKHLSSVVKMVAGISHEIRNPLGIISSSAELLVKRAGLGTPFAKISHIIVEESSRLNNIVTDFLDFARPRKPNFFICSIEDVIRKNITFFRTQAERKKCKIEVIFDKKLPPIMVDSDMLYQAFLNIFINAMQSMKHGGTINVMVQSDSKKLTVFIRDEGDGILDSIKNKIWDPFFTTKERGVGLGLGIVKNLVKSNYGKIKIRNRKKKGTCVSIEFPVHLKGYINGNNINC